MIKIFLELLRSTPCKFDSPTAVTVAKTTQKTPPIIGSGILIKTAPTLLISAQQIISPPAAWITLRAPTFVTLIAPIFSLYEVVPFPVPQIPAKIQPIPSIIIPRLSACAGGAFAPVN